MPTCLNIKSKTRVRNGEVYRYESSQENVPKRDFGGSNKNNVTLREKSKRIN